MRLGAFHAGIAALLLATPACEVIDRARNRGADADTVVATVTDPGALLLRMEAPGLLRPGEEGTIRASITNQGRTAVRGARLDLFVPGWVEPVAPAPGAREVTMATSEEEGIRLSYRLDDPPLGPGRTETVEQKIRIPPAVAKAEGQLWGRVVRARLTGPDGRAVTEVESEISTIGVPGSDSVPPGPADTAVAARRDRLGPVSLGMTSAALRQAAPRARDTTWVREGSPGRGVTVPLGQGGRAVAVLSGDTVSRIAVRDTVTRTRERLGVGSRLSELREAYGRACADVVEGETVVWFPTAPGIAFALDVRPPRDAQQVRQAPDRIPGSARVTHWWLTRGADRCPSR
ncbi:MAG TPA: hypothetical protein VGR37_14115 [Longimicrobiaceae bacterium]|nr:hypothetical protein [Longimicrobiaceae bacterium]